MMPGRFPGPMGGMGGLGGMGGMGGVGGMGGFGGMGGIGVYRPRKPRSKFAMHEDFLNNLDTTAGPTPYPLSDDERELICRSMDHETLLTPAKRRPNAHWSDVVNMLRFHNDPRNPLNPKQMRAYQRLKTLGKLNHWQPDIMIKIIFDLDAFLFAGVLKDNIAVRWGIEMDSPAVAYCMPLGGPIQEVEETARTTIVINVPYIVEREMDANKALMVVIHEMCHAVLSVCCTRAPTDLNDVATVDRHKDHDDAGHGHAFKKVVETVQGRLGRTRFLHITRRGGDGGGTVDRGTALESYWALAGGYHPFGKSPGKEQLMKKLFDMSREQEDALWREDGKPRNVRGDDERARARRAGPKRGAASPEAIEIILRDLLMGMGRGHGGSRGGLGRGRGRGGIGGGRGGLGGMDRIMGPPMPMGGLGGYGGGILGGRGGHLGGPILVPYPGVYGYNKAEDGKQHQNEDPDGTEKRFTLEDLEGDLKEVTDSLKCGEERQFEIYNLKGDLKQFALDQLKNGNKNFSIGNTNDDGCKFTVDVEVVKEESEPKTVRGKSEGKRKGIGQ